MSTHTLRVLTVHFDTPIEPWELPAFRRAVARKGGWEHQHFHNNNETGGLHYRLSQNQIEGPPDQMGSHPAVNKRNLKQ